MAFEKPAVVIDNGSRYIKAGFACDNHPVAMFRTVVARPRGLQGRYGRAGYYDVYIGDEAVARCEDMDLSAPLVNGKIVQWDNMERIWHHIFYKELKVAPEDRAIILTCAPDTLMAEKIRCCEIFFETLNSPALCVQSTSVLALYGSGYTTGITVDLGYDKTDINPIYEGGLISYAHMKTGYAGRQVCEYIDKSLAERDIDLGYNSSEIIDEIIKDSLYVTPNAAMTRRGFERYVNTDRGDKIEISQEAFMSAEMFFQPDLVLGEKSKYTSLQDNVVTASLKCDGELRTELYSAIVISGGLSMIPGIGPRLQAEITEKIEKPVNVITSDESYVVSWMGGATFAGIKDAQRMWVTKKQYEDHGIKIVKNRFM